MARWLRQIQKPRRSNVRADLSAKTNRQALKMYWMYRPLRGVETDTSFTSETEDILYVFVGW